MKALLLDVYETLLTGTRLTNPDPALREVISRFDLTFPADRSPSSELHAAILEEHRSSPEPYPEIDIRTIWLRLFPDLHDPDAFALEAECAMHPVTVMPGAIDAVNDFHRRGHLLGIVSNAQAYTRLLLARLLGETWHHFDSDLLFFSYEFGFAKPDPRIFEAAIGRLRQRGLEKEDIVMIGDSGTNDLRPARALGIGTIAFTIWPVCRRLVR